MSSSVFIRNTAPPSPPIEEVAVQIHALSAGHITLPEYQFVHPIDRSARKTVPSLAFLIQHRSLETGQLTRIVFDLGVRRDLKRYAEPIQRHVATRQPLSTDPDVVKSLAKGGLKPDDIDYVIYSHVHWDHIGEPRDFPKSTFVVGNGALALLAGTSSSLRGGHSFFEADLLPSSRSIELSSPGSPSATHQSKPGTLDFEQPWRPRRDLPHVLDLFQDGSLYIVDAPGHLPGHINILARTSETKWVYLGGDACHDRRLLTGEKEIGEWNDAEGHICCIHANKKAAEETIERIRKLEASGVEVIFAHDDQWENNERNKGRFWGTA